MARTAHHVPYRRTDHHLTNMAAWADADARGVHQWSWPPAGPFADHVLWDLRYSAAELAVRDRKPQPQRVRIWFVSYDYGRAYRSRRAAYKANRDERAARMRLRVAKRRARAQLRWATGAFAGDPTKLVDSAWDVDIVPVRHRNRALWDC